jgi:hypothetical protein
MKNPSDRLETNPPWWDKVGPRDFDGHTEFHRLTPEERLVWLCQVQRFYWATKASLPNSGMRPSGKENVLIQELGRG